MAANEGLQLISAVLATGSFSTLSEVSEEMFTASEQDAYNYVRNHFRRYGELPQPTTVVSECGVRLPNVRESIAYYIDGMYDRHLYNQIAETWNETRTALTQKDMATVREKIGVMHQHTRRGRQRADVHMNLREATQLSIDRLHATRGLGGITGIESGWPSVDEKTGGYQNGDLIALVGRMGLGKTYVLLKQAHAARAAGHVVLVVTTEMSAEQMARRNLSIQLGLNPTLLKKNMVSTYMERRIVALCNDHVWMDGYHILSVGMNSTVGRVEGLMQELNPDIVFVDGAYLMRPTNMAKNANRMERVAGTMDELKGLTLSADRPIYFSTQFNRTAGKGGKEGTLETIGFTDAIGTHSSVIKALKAGHEDSPRSRLLDFLKGREGESGEIAINFKFAPLDMSEMTPEQREEDGDIPEPNQDWQV